MTRSDARYPIFRMSTDTDPGSWGIDHPSNVAAYLRFWGTCLEDHLPAVYTTDEPPLLWSLTNIDERIESQPRFRVVFRFGFGRPLEHGPLSVCHFPSGQCTA